MPSTEYPGMAKTGRDAKSCTRALPIRTSPTTTTAESLPLPREKVRRSSCRSAGNTTSTTYPVLDAEVRVSTKCDTTGNADGVTGCEHKRQRVVHPELAACVEFLLPNDAPEVLQRASGSEPAGFTLLIPATKYCGDHCPAWDTDDGSPLPDPEDGFAQQSIDQLATRSSSLRLGAASPDFTIVTCTRFGSMEAAVSRGSAAGP